MTETMPPAVRRVRAYFAPVNRGAQQPTIFDPAQQGMFALDAPPAPWIDLGWISGFARKSGTKIEPVRAGAPAIPQMQSRSAVDATVSFQFASWGKLQMALAAGTQQMNLLKVQTGAASAGSGGVAIPAVALQSGSTATVLQLGAAGCELRGRRDHRGGCRLHRSAWLRRERRERSVREERADGRRLHPSCVAERRAHLRESRTAL